MRRVARPTGLPLQLNLHFFPDGALIGVVCAMPNGDAVQTAMIGWDGALGVFEACGSRRSAFLAEVQVAGAAWSRSVGSGVATPSSSLTSAGPPVWTC